MASGPATLCKTVLVSACTIMLMMTLKIVDLGPVAALRNFTFDTFQRLEPRQYRDTPVRVVDIDDQALMELGQWPWPRTKVAALLERLAELGAATVVLDMIFAEPDRTSPSLIAEVLEAGNPEATGQVRDMLMRLPDHDEVFAEALRKMPVVLGFAALEQTRVERPAVKSGYAIAGTHPREILKPFRGAVRNLDTLEQAAGGVGGISLGQDSASEIVRQLPMLFSDGDGLYPGLTLEALRVAQGAASVVIRSTGASREQGGGQPALVDLRVGQFPVPLTPQGELFLYYDRNRSDRIISVRDLFDRSHEETTRARVEGHIVFVGTSAAGLLDRRITALGETVAGVTIHAQAAEQILAQDFLWRPDWASGAETVATLLSGVIVAFLLTRLGARYAALVIAGVAACLLAAAWLVFSEFRVLLDPVYPTLSALIVYFALTALFYLTTDRDRRFIRQAFGRYLAPELLHKLEAAPDTLRLGGEIRPMTILFLDIRGFTAISERLSPEALVNFLNALFSPLTDAIQREQGVVDKYIGDSVMAFWNAPVDVPDHAARACAAALRMRDIVDQLNRNDAFGLQAAGLNDWRVQVGIGLNTGAACVGNMGSEARFNYSTVGDAVNIAARIEGECKRVGAPILVSEATIQAAPGFAVLEAGAMTLKGKSEPVKLFALVGDHQHASSADFQHLTQDHRQMLDAIAAGDEKKALEHLLACRRRGGPALVGFYSSFIDRLRTSSVTEMDPDLISSNRGEDDGLSVTALARIV